MGLDPVCKMEVNPASAAGQSDYEGQTFYFCSMDCKRKFDANSAAVHRRDRPGAGSGAPRRAGEAALARRGRRRGRGRPLSRAVDPRAGRARRRASPPRRGAW